MNKTPLYDIHISLGAKVAPFGGYEMPIQYTGILEEHAACRNGVAIFDICHMGEFYLEGPNAVNDLENILTCTIYNLDIGQCRYGFICNESGGIIDDQIVYRLEEEKFMMVVNSATCEKDSAWIQEHLSVDTLFTDMSDSLAKIDIQGPKSPKLLEKFIDDTLTSLTYFRTLNTSIQGVDILVSRTGYTGEVGFELYFEASHAQTIWTLLTDAGAVPVGLGARDTLRLEMGLPLYGHELSETTNPLSTGYTRSIDLSKEFIGKTALENQTKTHILAGICFEGRQKPRDEEQISNLNGEIIGSITSGGFSPSLEKGIALCYIKKEYAQAGTSVQILRKRKSLDGTVTALPFYTEATARKKMATFL